MIAASVAIGLAQAAVPITRPYMNITEFARFDGNYSDAIRINGLTVNDAAADNGMAFEVIYRHPDVARSDLSQVADTTVFTLEKTRSFVFDECRAHPYITPTGQLPAVNTLCRARTTAVQCAGPRRGVLYENRGAAIGAYGTKPFNPALEQARQSVEAGRGDPNLTNQCIWVSASASRASLSLWTRLDSNNQPYMQLEYTDRRRSTLVNGNLVGHRFDVPRPDAPPSNVPDREYYGTNGENFNQWHHAVINVIPTPGSTTGATVEFWMDGSLWLTSTDDDDFRGGGANRYDLMYIGGRPLGGRGFIGDVAKFRVYRQSLQSRVITGQIFTRGEMNSNQANSFLATEWPTSDTVAALAQQVNVNRRTQQPYQVRSLHFDGSFDTLKLPPMQLSTDFTVEIMFKIEYDHPRNWVLCQFATTGADETSRFIIKRLVDGSNDPEVPDSLEITYQRDNDVGANPRNNAITRVVRTDPILVSDVWHHLVVAVTSAYDIHVRVDGTLVSQGQFFRTAPGLVSRYADRQGSVNWDNSYLGSMNACANFFTGDIGFLRVYQAALSYNDVRRLFSNARGGLFANLQRFKFEFQTPVDLTTTGVSNTGRTSGATYGLAQASETAEALPCPNAAAYAQNAPAWTSGRLPVPYLNQIRYSARFGGSYLGATGTQSVTGSGMRLSPLDVAEGGATFEVIYRHNNNSDDLMSYVNDVLVDLRDTGTILTSRCEKQGEPANQGSCTAATSRLACVGRVPWRQRSPYQVTAANGGTTYAPVSYGTGAGVTDGPCVWVDRSIDDVSVTMKYARTRPASNETDVPQLQMLFVYKDPRYNEYNSEGTGREYSVQIQTDPFTIDSDFGRWHHVFVTAPTGADGYWQIWLDNRVISGRNQALRYLGLYDDFRPGFISGTPIKAASFTNNHLGSSMGQWNTHQGNVAAFRVYPQTLTVPQVVACFNSTRGHNPGVGSLEVEPSMNYTFTDRSIAASGVRFMPAVKNAIRTSLFEGEREIYTFDDTGDDVELPAMPIPDAFSVAITFKPMLDIQRSFGLFSLHQRDPATSPPNVDWGSFVEISGQNYTHGRITVSRPGRSWVAWTGNWNIAFRTINQLVVTVIPTGEVHARLNGVVLCHGGLEGAVSAAGSQPDQFSGGYINAAKNGMSNMNGIYGAVKIYNRALSYPEVAALFTDDANGQDSYLSHSWSFAPDLNYPDTIRDTGGAHGTFILPSNPTHGLLFTRLDLGVNDYVTFTGEREDTLALPNLTLATGDAGFSVETIFQWADPCPINDLAFCAHIRDTCTHTLPEYVDAVLTGNPNFPGLQECVTSVCCYCDYGYSREPECNAAQVDWGAVIGTSTLNAGCALLNTGVFAPEFVIGDPSAPAWAFTGYTASCSDYTQCPFQVESTAELAAGRAETQNDTSTALCKYLEGKCTNDLNSIVVGASNQEECVTNMCCFCEMGHSDKAVCDSAMHAFQFSSGSPRARTMTMNTMCRELVADAPQYDLQCADSPFNAQRFQGSEVFGMRNRGADIRDQCLPIDTSSSSDATYCAAFRENAVQLEVPGRRACCGSETCNLTVSDAFPTRNMAFEPANQQCAWVGADNDDTTFALSRVIEQEGNVGRGSLRSGFMQARYVDKSRFERRPDGGALLWGVYVNGEPIKEGGDRFDKWHHAILNVDSDGSWTYWVNGEVASGMRVSGANRMDGTDTQARRGSVRTPPNPDTPSRSKVMSTNFNSNRLGWKLEGKIGRMKVFNRHLDLSEIESSFNRGADIVGEVFSLEDSMPLAFRNQLGLPRDGYENANNNLGLRFDRFEDSARMGQTTDHEHISITDGVKLPTSFTIRMLVKPYMIQNHRTSLLGMFTSNTDPSRPELYASMLVVNRLQNGGVRVVYRASIDDLTVDEQTLGGLFVHDEVHQLIIQVTAANLLARQAQVTIIFDGKVVNHGAYQATQAMVGGEVVMATARINGNIGDDVYPNPMTFYAVHIYEDAFGYDMRPATGAFDASKLRYNWTFSDRGELTAGIVSNSAPGYPSATGAGAVNGDATVENGPGFRRGREQSRINREIVQYKVLPGSDSDRVNNVLSASGQANAGGVDLGRAGTTFEMIFNTTVDTRESAAAQSQHLFDMYDNNDTPNDVTDDRRMRLYQTTIPVVNGDWSQTFLRFEWMDGAREAQADNLMAGPNEGFGFILESAPHWPATYSQRPHHIILTVTEEGTWTMWQDGEVISGYLSAIANPDRENLENQAQRRYLAHPGGVTAEPLCRRAFGPNCGTTFSTVVVGGSYTSLRGGGQDAFQGDISMFRVLPHSVTAFQAQRMYYEGPDISVSKCNYTTSCTYESDIPIVNWVPCKQTAILANVSLSIEGDACNDYNYSSATDSCGADGYCSVRVGFARRDSNTTSMPGTSASSGDDSSNMGTGVMIAAAVAALLLCIIVAVAVVKVKKLKQLKAEGHKEVSFENPMYDEGGKENPAFEGDGNYDEPNYAGTGYMDVPPSGAGGEAEGSGYMDVSPSGAGDADDDI